MLNKPTLSACMMVKNEEDNIHRCLSSFAHLVDEIIVVDTGSTDNTIQICKDFGAKVFEHPWQNDFSYHRNQSISYATGDWIFIIDADEEIVLPEGNEDADFLKNYLFKQPENINAVLVELFDIQKDTAVMKFNTARFFKRGSVHYEGIVHNSPSLTGSKDGVFCKLFYLNHYGYDLEEDKMAAKELRTIGLLEDRLRKNPNDYDCYFYLAQAHSTKHRWKEAVECGEFYLAHKDILGSYFNRCIYYNIFHSYVNLNDLENAKKWISEGIKELPDDLDIAMAEVEFGMISDSFFNVYNGGRRYMTIYQKLMENPSIRGNRFMFTNNPLALSFVIFHLGTQQIFDGIKVLDILKESLKTCPKEYRHNMLSDLQKFFEGIDMNVKITVQEKEEVISDEPISLFTSV